ncbi:MAG TPA: hypothetical protein VF928_00895 [Usitatibacteraceae bacterium]
MSKYIDHVQLAPQFQRAIRIDLDWGNVGALKGYLCQGSAAQAVRTIVMHLLERRQSAFTLTGPYGGGKSSLALVLASLLGGEVGVRRAAKEVLGDGLVNDIAKPLRVPTNGSAAKLWHVVLVAGRREDPITSIAKALASSGIPYVTKRLGERPDATRVLKVLSDLSEQPEVAGLFLVIDELGKMLEHAASFGGDIHFFQELAEIASRSHGRFLFLGILHQAFEMYGARLGHEARVEWGKIQGRFADIPLVAGVDEVIELTGRAIASQKKHPKSKKLAQLVADCITQNRPASAKDLPEKLDACWPLHPVTAALLGPVSKRRFGQNERSTFAFLGSGEPEGFLDFLKNVDDGAQLTYEPARYWDYLCSNLEPTILVSPDGHRWAQASEAVSRCEGRGSSLHVRLIKSIAIIDLFRNGSGLNASQNLLLACLADSTEADVDAALKDLLEWSVVIYRSHLKAYGVFEGSDFDIAAAVQRQLNESHGLDVVRLSTLVAMQPILPKRHYHESGALRWFESQLATIESLPALVKSSNAAPGLAGRFVLVIPNDQLSEKTRRAKCREASSIRADFPLAIGLPSNADTLRSLGREFVALESLSVQHPELMGDSVARKEVVARTAAVSGKLEEELLVARSNAEWFVNGESLRIGGAHDLHTLASNLCEAQFAQCPPIFSELVNRENISSNAQAAVNALLVACVTNDRYAAAGITNYSAERGLYETVFAATGLHQSLDDVFGFHRPRAGDLSAAFEPVWAAADALLANHKEIVKLTDIYRVWKAAPFGLTGGVMPLIGLAYIMSNRASMAMYLDDVYQPDITDVFAHEIARDPKIVALRRVIGTAEQSKLLRALSETLFARTRETVAPEPLALGRALVKFYLNLPPWTRRTQKLSVGATKLKSTLHAAADPPKLVLVDLPSLAGSGEPKKIAKFLGETLDELGNAYSNELEQTRTQFLGALGVVKGREATLKQRAAVVQGITGDLRLEALATRLASDGMTLKAFEDIVGLAVNRPARELTDLDFDRATMAVADLALQFRHAEMLAAVRNRKPSRLAIGVVVGTGESGQTTMRSIDVGNDEMEPVQEMADEVYSLVERYGSDMRLALAALATVGVKLIDKLPESKP